MKHKLRFSFVVFLLLLLSAGASFAVVIPGHDGTSLPLSQIPDIIRHVTGRTSRDLCFGKESLFIYSVYSDARQQEDLYTFKADGSSNRIASLTGELSRPVDPSQYQSASAVNISALKSGNRAKHLLNFAAINNNEPIRARGYLNSSWAYVSDAPDAEILQGSSRYVLQETRDTLGHLADTEAGITVNGYDGELIAILIRRRETFFLHLVKVSADINPTLSKAEAVSCSWSCTIYDYNLPRMFDNTVYYPLSMAAGDFDNDGYANEIAVIHSDKIAPRYHVLQISHTGTTSDDARFSLRVLSQGDVGSYEYGGRDSAYAKRYEKMDGLSCTYSLCAVAGDFDGDRKTEFAVVWRDTWPQHTSLTVNNHSYGNPIHSDILFSGYTGRIHLKTFKWNGSVFQTEEDVHAFDDHYYTYTRYGDDGYNDLDIPLGVKAAVGDFDGDGHDDIAVLRVMLQYTEKKSRGRVNYMAFSNYVFGAFVDWYTFDKDSIKPKYNAHSEGPQPWNYGDNANGWVGIRSKMNVEYPLSGMDDDYYKKNYFLRPLTAGEVPYPVIDREFDIIAGKFSSRISTIDKFRVCDDLVIKYPQWAADSDVKTLRSHIALMTNIPGVTNWGTHVYEITAIDEFNPLIALAKSDYLGESVHLDDPVKITDTTDDDYTAILQMFPYHVDNLTEDGRALQKNPQNFTLRLNTAVTYKNTSSASETKNLTYSMTRVAETIFALDNPAIRTASKTYQGIRGISTAIFGDNEKVKKIDSIGGIWDKLKDTVETTQSQSSKNSSSYTMSITTQANYQDTLFMNQSTRYIWRYPIQEVPAPAWILGQSLDHTASFDASRAINQRSYLTFAMSEPATPTSATGLNDSNYNPYHELGNLFSYPPSLEQTEGYKDSKSLTKSTYSGPIRWNGAEFKHEIELSVTSTDQQGTKKVNRIGAITKFLSVIDNIFGSNLAKIPQDSESSYKRSVTDGESISLNIPAAYSGARFTALFETYLDIAGTTTSVFAVESFNRDDALWGTKSLYTLRPDPSLVLPEKFNYKAQPGEWDRATFVGNDNDPTAIKMRGVRFKLKDYDIDSNSLLVKGLTYTISVPVYNASFKDAENFKVRLSYAETNEYDSKKTKIDEVTFTKLPGWGNGNSRQTATFTWTPDSRDMKEGTYYLFAEIDPENEIKEEVHKNRRNASGDIVDYGGNNLGYCRIGIVDANSPVFNRHEVEDLELLAEDSEGFAFPYVHWVKADGLDLEDFIKQKVDGASSPVPAAVELMYGGEYLMTNAHLIGYKLKPATESKDISEITDSDIGLVFADLKFAFFPNDDHKLHFSINPEYLEDGIYFVLNVHGEEYALTDVIYGSAGTARVVEGVGSSSSGGCYSGFGLIALLGVFGIAMTAKKR